MACNTHVRLGDEAGFTLVDILMAVTLMAIISGMAVAGLRNVGESIQLGTSAREVERELQTARLKAVTSNRVMRLRFNCPVAGQYRMVELLGTASAPAAEDTPANRCSGTMYPFPPPDLNPMTVPNHDGPTRRLPEGVTFGASKTLDFWPDGTVHAEATGITIIPWPLVEGSGTAVTLVKGENQKTITVNSLGKITLQ